MSVIKKHPSHLDIVVQSAEDVTAFGGAAVADAVARDSGLWEQLAAAVPDMEHRNDKARGIRPDALVAQLLTSFVTGGISVADAGRLAKDSALGKLIGLPKMADETTLCKWLNAQTAESVARMWEINRKFLDWVFKQVPQEQLRDTNGKMSVFFDDTEVELDGHYFENSAVNYNATRPTLSKRFGSADAGWLLVGWTKARWIAANTSGPFCWRARTCGIPTLSTATHTFTPTADPAQANTSILQPSIIGVGPSATTSGLVF